MSRVEQLCCRNETVQLAQKALSARRVPLSKAISIESTVTLNRLYNLLTWISAIRVKVNSADGAIYLLLPRLTNAVTSYQCQAFISCQWKRVLLLCFNLNHSLIFQQAMHLNFTFEN